MAKYFVHNNEQELTMGSPYHNLLGNVPSGWTVVEYQNEGEQADVSDAALAIESEAGLTITGTPSIVVELSCYVGLRDSNGDEVTTKANKWICIPVNPSGSWTTITDSMTEWVAMDDQAHDDLIAMGKPS
tara:strand:- start:3435 stop:3824 length:390 start_codon:yes stop_codon:yes gene_type:complete